MSVAEESLRMSGLFEAELLVELMLRFWNHPWADDRNFRGDLLESASEVLSQSVAGVPFIEGLKADSMNLIAAVWYSEWSSIQELSEQSDSTVQQRQQWLQVVRKTIPSSFCDPELLG